MPILYSNIHLRYVPYTYVTTDLLCRKEFRFAYKSILLLDEFSLIANQMMHKLKGMEEVNERMNEFFKLYRHETRGGYMIINSQCILRFTIPIKICY